MPPWSLLARVGFRFAASWGALNAIPLAFAGLGDFWPPAMKLQKIHEAPGLWLGRHLLGIAREIPTAYNGSGDRTVDWLSALFLVGAALLMTILWSIADRRRMRYDRAFAWVHVATRYALGLILLGYGLAKVFVGQFPPPQPPLLMQELGEISPMRLLWSFMGFSTGYTFFCGAAEVLAALLLWFRRTAMLGALVSAAAMANICALNFFYDVPVKLFSTQLFLISLFLLVPHARRLMNFLVLGRAVEAAPLDEPRFSPRWKPWLKAFVLGALVTMNLRTSWLAMRELERRPTLFGAWQIDGMTWQPGTAPLGAPTWRKLAFGGWSVAVRAYDGTLLHYRAKYEGNTVTLTRNQETIVASWREIDAAHVVLDGKRGQDAITLELTRAPAPLLLSRGFHFINEFPFNR